MTSEREQVWTELLDATPPGWYVGRPSYHDERDEWIMYAFDPSETAKVGRRSREWTTVHPTEIGVVREMARCLHDIKQGRVPKGAGAASSRPVRCYSRPGLLLIVVAIG